MAKRTASGLNEIRKLINVEHKYIDVDSSTFSTRTGAVQYISPCAQGDDITQRDGDSIKVQSIRLSGVVYRDTLSAQVSDTVRVLVVRDLQNAGASPAVTDVLQTVGTAYSAFTTYDFLNGIDLNKRFSIVYDTIVYLDLYHPTGQFGFTSNHDCHVIYRGTGSTAASAGNGSYFLVTVSSNTVNPPVLDYNSFIRFTDN